MLHLGINVNNVCVFLVVVGGRINYGLLSQSFDSPVPEYDDILIIMYPHPTTEWVINYSKMELLVHSCSFIQPSL